MRYCLTPVRTTIINKGANKHGQGHGERGTLMHCEWECRLVQLLRKFVCCYLKKLTMELPYHPVISLLGIYMKKPKTLTQKNIYTSMLIASLFTIDKIWKNPKCPSVDEWIKRCSTCIQRILLNHKKEILPFVTSWLDLMSITLSEISQSEKDKYHMILLICAI